MSGKDLGSVLEKDMKRVLIRIGKLGCLHTLAAFAAIMPVLSVAQNVISEDFTGTTINNSWTAINGACLTAGAASNGSIPSCVGLPYYINNGDSYQVGGQFGFLGNASAPSSNANQSPDALGSGALRLTNGSPFYHESGAIVSTAPFNASSGVQVTFKTVAYAGDSGGTGGDGADGISFFLLDASQYTGGSGLLGSWGGSLGYTCSNQNPPYTGQVGAYIGLGMDEYGNFLNGGMNGSGGYNDNTATGVAAVGWGSGNYQWDRIGLRGAGNVAWSWLNTNANTAAYYPSSLTPAQQQAAVRATCETGTLWNYAINPSSPTNTGIAVADYAPIPGGSAVLSGVTIANETATTRAQATPIYYVLNITGSGLLSLSYSYGGGALTQVLTNQSITASNGNLPSTLLFGFAGSTGGSDNIHEIMCFQAAPADQSDTSTTVNLPQDKLVTTAQIYLPSYHTNNWWGQLAAQTLSQTGPYTLTVSNTVNWDAACQLTGTIPGTNNYCQNIVGSTGTAQSPTASGANGRQILTWNGASGVAFEWSNLATGEQNALDPGVAAAGPSNRLSYLRGDRSDECPTTGCAGPQIYRDRTGVLGDIMHSSPFWVGPPSNTNYEANWSDNLYPAAVAAEDASGVQNYQSFNNTYTGRENVVYIGANDGLLHGFRSGSFSNGSMVTTSYPNDGLEVFAYMPGAIVNTIHSASTAYDYSSPNYSHTFAVDAPPRGDDLFFSNAWHTWLVGGLGAGGSAIYALDVTDPTQFSESNASSLVVGEWTPSNLSCVGNASCGAQLNNTYGTPIIWRFHAANVQSSNMWGMVFGNGFPNQITGSVSGNALTVTAGNGLAVGQQIVGSGVAAGTKITSLGTGTGGPGTYIVNNSQALASEPMAAINANSTGTAGMYVMLVDPATGQQSFYYLDTGYGPSKDPLGQGRPNGIAYVSPVDLDGDNTVDYVYAGDLFGNVWRFDLTSNIATSWAASKFGNAVATPLFSTPTTTVNGVLVGQPITSQLVVVVTPLTSGQSGVVVDFGTGQEIPLTPVSPTSYAAGPQSLYGIWDWDMSNWNSLSHMALAAVAEPFPLTQTPKWVQASNLATQTVSVVTPTGSSTSYETDTNNPVCWYGMTGITGCTSYNQFGWTLSLPNTTTSGTAPNTTTNYEQVIYNPSVWQGVFQINTTIPSGSTIFSCTIDLPSGYTMLINPTTGGGYTSSPFLDGSGNPITVGGVAVSGVQTGGTGTITNISAGGNNFWLTDTSNGTQTSGAEQAEGASTGHRVTWSQLR